MSGKVVIKLVVIVLILTPLAVVSTPPELPPYYGYSITAQIVRKDGGSLEHFPIVLAAKCYGAWHILNPGGGRGCGYVYPEKGVTVALTRENGRAALSVYVQAPPLDSMALAIALPDTTIYGRPFRRRHAEYDFVIYEDRWVEDEGYLCSDSMDWESEEVGTQYYFLTDTLLID